ncbi:putative membrane protein mmpL3 [Rhodococcus sp. RD6.2]|uniref:MMPL family transporter n=1 Tax=Rhodococcus sp. RD6.2 TaxID=260936 RepID=UPI00063BC226|nr:MMPL family transporter [Rhodococcus sp. RD6.2]CRK50619.1 putative membrane protein mmpL3 [Rhodococcus sp. RD6.2]
MFATWGQLVYRLRFTVIGVMVALMLGLGAYGLGLEKNLSQSGWDDPGSESVAAAKLADGTFGRDTTADVVLLYTAPDGKTVDDPTFASKITKNLEEAVTNNPDQILKVNGSYWTTKLPQLADATKQHAIASVAIAGANDTEVAANFREVRDVFYIDGIDVQLAGLQPVTGTLNDTMANDVHRMELLAIPAVGVLLFFVFGGVVAAALPLIVGGLTIIAANGIVKLFTLFTDVNAFVVPVVSLIGLGLAIDYGLFMVSRFREEIAEGYETGDAVRRTVMTAGRTVVFSATMVTASLGGLLIFPQGFLKSVAYGAIAAVMLAALISVTVLPAILAILGRRVDALGLKFMRKTKTAEEIENSYWGRLTQWVMKNPLKVAIPIVIGLLLLTIPISGIKFGGINETYLPPDNETRLAQEQFDELFPNNRTEPIKLVVEGAQGAELTQIVRQASEAPGLVEKFSINNPTKDGVTVFKAGLVDRNDSEATIEYLRAMDVPDGATVLVGGTPAIEQDSIAALLDSLPLMVALVVLLTTLLMFLAFGSLVLPIKAVLMTALGLGATLGILTWIFIDGHGATLMNFTPGPIMSPVLVLIMAIIYGLSTDYEVFLLSRMVEARAQGASTTESVRVGTAHTGRIITAAALILIVVTGAFAFSELVMMKYIAYGMIAALVLDATVIRMFLVPAVMKLLGDDCWWAPAWMKRIQERMGLGEPILDDERIPADVPEIAPVGVPAPRPQGAQRQRSTPLTREAVERVLPPRTAAASRIAATVEPLTGEPMTEPIPQVAPRPAPERQAPERPAPEQRQEPEQKQASRLPQDAVRPPAQAPQPPRPPQAPVSPRRGTEPPATANRPIESWLSSLRVPTGSQANGNAVSEAHAGAPGHQPQARPAQPQGRAPQAGPAQSQGQPLPPRPAQPQGQQPQARPGQPPQGRPAQPERTAQERPTQAATAAWPAPTPPAPATESQPADDPSNSGRHRHTDGAPTVSVSELLARQRRD